MPCATSSRAWATPAWTSAALTIVGGGAKAPVAPDQGRRDRPAGARPDQRRDHRLPGPPSLAAVGAGVHTTVAEAVDAFVAYQPDEHVPTPSATRSTARPTATTATYTSPSSRCSSDSVTRPADGGSRCSSQLIQGQVADAEQVHAALDRWAGSWPRRHRLARLDAGVTDDSRFIALARFESAEAARQQRPAEQDSWLSPETAGLFTGEATFSDSDDVVVDAVGDPGSAGSSRSSRAAAATPTAPGS